MASDLVRMADLLESILMTEAFLHAGETTLRNGNCSPSGVAGSLAALAARSDTARRCLCGSKPPGEGMRIDLFSIGEIRPDSVEQMFSTLIHGRHSHSSIHWTFEAARPFPVTWRGCVEVICPVILVGSGLRRDKYRRRLDMRPRSGRPRLIGSRLVVWPGWLPTLWMFSTYILRGRWTPTVMDNPLSPVGLGRTVPDPSSFGRC